MKKHTLLLLFIINALNGMENGEQISIPSQAPGFLYFLEKYDIQTENRAIIHIECGMGGQSAKLAEKASRVHGCDQTKDCIDFAQAKYHNTQNLSFEHCPSITFNYPRTCNLALIDYTAIDPYTNTNENKKELFQCIHQHLSPNGEIFVSIVTSDNTLHPNITAAINMAPHIQAVMPDSTEESIIELMMPSYPSVEELLAMLEETGFKVTTNEELYITKAISTTDLYNSYSSIVEQNPLFACIQDNESRLKLSSLFIRNYINILAKDNDNNVLEPTITTIIRAHKIGNAL